MKGGGKEAIPAQPLLRPVLWLPVQEQDEQALGQGGLYVKIGAMTVRIAIRVPEARRAFRFLYGGFPATPEPVPADFSIDLSASSFFRRWFRRDARAVCDIPNPSPPLSACEAILALEMGLNLQTAFASNRFLALHGGVVAHGDAAAIVTEGTGGGKSTLSAALSCLGWRYLSDEFCLVEPENGALIPYPRPAALKGASIEALRDLGAGPRLLTPLEGTFKGRISWLRPDPESVGAMDIPARPALIVLPRFTPGARTEIHPAGKNEIFLHLASGAANYETMGEAGFDRLSELSGRIRAIRLVYGDLQEASRVLKAELGGIA